METIGMTKSYPDDSRGLIPTSSDEGSSPHRPAFQRCHRLQARLDALSAGLCELNMLHERQERLVKEAMCLPLSCIEGEEKHEEEEEDIKEEVRKETDAFGNKQEYDGKVTDPTKLMGDLVERLEIIGVVNNTSDVTTNSETSSRKSSGFFEALDTDILVQSRKNSVAEFTDVRPDMTTSGEVRRVEESVRKLSECSLDGDVSRLVRNRNESSSLPDYRGITRAKFACKMSAEKVTASENHEAKSVGLKRSLSMKTARKLSFSCETGSDSKSTTGGSVIGKSRPCLVRSISVPEPRNNTNTEYISKEELIRRKRRSVHEIDFSLHRQPGLASQCYMGSSRAFRYPSPLHAISLQSPLCLPGPGYNEQQKEELNENQIDTDSTQVTDSRTQSECIKGTLKKEKFKVGKSGQSFEVLDTENQASTKALPSLAANDLIDRCFSPTNNKLIPHSGKTKEASTLSSHKNSVLIAQEKPQNKTHHMSVELEHKNQNGTHSSADRTNRKPRPQRKGVQEPDIEASYNYNMVTSSDSGAHPVPGCKQKPSKKISSNNTNFGRSQNEFDLERGDVRYTDQNASRQGCFQDTEWLYPGRRSEYQSHQNRHISGRSNLSTAGKSHIDSNGHYNDGVVRSKTHVRQSLSRADGRQSGTSSRMKESQIIERSLDDSKQVEPRPQPRRKNACVTPVEIWAQFHKAV